MCDCGHKKYISAVNRRHYQRRASEMRSNDDSLDAASSEAQSIAQPVFCILTAGQRFGQRCSHASVASELHGLYAGGAQRISLAAETV